MDKCYNRIPVYYDGQIRFVDPITRQTFDFAHEQPCDTSSSNLHQLNPDDDDSWYTLSPNPQHFDSLALFTPKAIHPFTDFNSYSSTKAGMFTNKQFKEFWDTVLHNHASTSILQKFSRQLITEATSSSGSSSSFSNYLGMPDKIYVDNLVSPNFFTHQFVETFGTIIFYLEKFGIYFAVFMFLKLVIDIILSIVRYLSIDKATKQTVGFARNLLNATCNPFFLSIITSIYNQQKDEEPEPEHFPLEPKQRREARQNSDLYTEIHGVRYPQLTAEVPPFNSAPLPPI